MSASAGERDVAPAGLRALTPASWESGPLAIYAGAVVANAVAAATFFGLSALAAAYGVWSRPLLVVSQGLFSATTLAVAASMFEHHRRVTRLRTPLWLVGAVLTLASAGVPWLFMRAPAWSFGGLAVAAAAGFAAVLGLRAMASALPEDDSVDRVALADRATRMMAAAYTLAAAALALAISTEPGDLGWPMMLRYAALYVAAEAVVATVRIALGISRQIAREAIAPELEARR